MLKKIDEKKLPEKKLAEKNFGQKRICPKKYLAPKKWFVRKKTGPKKYWAPHPKSHATIHAAVFAKIKYNIQKYNINVYHAFDSFVSIW